LLAALAVPLFTIARSASGPVIVVIVVFAVLLFWKGAGS
jgi:hypothetical protein